MVARHDRAKVHNGRRKKGQKKRRMATRRRLKLTMRNHAGRNRKRRYKRLLKRQRSL